MLLDKSSYESKSPQDRALAKDVIMDATKFGQQFEQQLGRLSAYDSPEAVGAMTDALEKMDVLNNSLNLHKEVCPPCTPVYDLMEMIHRVASCSRSCAVFASVSVPWGGSICILWWCERPVVPGRAEILPLRLGPHKEVLS